jgi:hypothetical protein
MKRRVVVINFCMLVGIILMALRFISAWESFEEASSLEQIVNRTEGRDSALLDVEPMSPSPPFSDFIVISERNLFSEDRRPPAVEGEEEEPEVEIVVEEPPTWTDRPALHGMSVVGGKRQAILTAFEGPQGGQLRTVSVGDSVQGYTIVEIGNSMVRLKWKDQEEFLDMADSHGIIPTKALSIPAASVTVITVGAAPAAVQKASGKATGQPQGTGIQVSVVSGQSNPAGDAQAGRSPNQAGSASAEGRGAQRSPGR